MAWFKDKVLKKLKNAFVFGVSGFRKNNARKKKFLGNFVFSGKNDV